LIAMFAIVGATFLSCQKDDEESLSNYIKITGEFSVGDKIYTNPTFDLGEPDLHKGYLSPMVSKTGNMIKVMLVDNFELGNDIVLYYEYYIYGETVGEFESSAYVGIYLTTKGEYGTHLYCDDLTTKITKVGAVGGYIEGEYEGTFYQDKKAVEGYPIKGKFKVKRIADEQPI
ncbi:MAG TPA: hypothetical protein P5145_04365, partial [Tenuifilaceae bacterium]|nr:hypothetical protein [Tenuifilaceae bacterium]